MAKPTDPIAVDGWSGNAGSYNSVPVDQADSRYNDPLVRISDFGITGESFYARTDGRNWPYHVRLPGSLDDVWCRRLVAQKLHNINAALAPHGCELYVWDGYRPVQCQLGLWDHFSAIVRRQLPDGPAAEIRSRVLTYISDPTSFDKDDPTTWPVHSCGGAVDLTLRCLKTGRLLDMGARFDELGEVSRIDYYESKVSDLPDNQVAAIRANRRLLYWAMSEAGFVNYPPEFWHYDWGDQMYVYNRRALGLEVPECAWFGYTELPSNE